MASLIVIFGEIGNDNVLIKSLDSCIIDNE